MPAKFPVYMLNYMPATLPVYMLNYMPDTVPVYMLNYMPATLPVYMLNKELKENQRTRQKGKVNRHMQQSPEHDIYTYKTKNTTL